MRSSKMSLLCRAIDPTFQDNRDREEFGFSTLAPLKPLLRQTRCQILTTRSAGESLLVVFHLRRNPSGALIPYKTTTIGNVQRVILGRVTRSIPAEQKARGTSVKPFVTNSTSMQSSWSTRRGYLPTLGLSCQLMWTFWPVYIPQGHKELTRILYESFTPLLPKIITNKCLLRLHHLAMSPSMLLRKQPRSLGFFSFTPSTVWTRPIKRLRATPTNVNHLGPSRERWRNTEFRRTRVSW